MLEITVVFPYYNENETILTTLDLISKQTKMPAEVIFVNSSSTDRTSETIDGWIKENQNRFETKFRNLFEGTNTPGSSKNVGIRNARSTWVAFMDCGLLFPTDWLGKQWDFIQKNGVEVVSGVCYLEGEGIMDTAAVAQTYGFRRKRPCLPSSVVKKSIFERTGLFLENRRAGYDVTWPLLLRRMKIQRGINSDVVVKYNGVNFGNSLTGIFRKSIIYAIPLVNLRYYRVPYYYLLFITVFILVSVFSLYFSLFLIGVYLLLRGYIIPINKSAGIRVFIEKPLIIILLPLLGIVIDTGKLIGFLIGCKKYLISYKVYMN